MNYQWHGEPVEVEFGYSIVHTNKEKNLWWYNYYCRDNGSARLPAIRVTSKDGYSFVIGNQFGVGVHKLLNGGWPNKRHYSLPNEGFQKVNSPFNTEFVEMAYRVDVLNRERWEELNFPQEYEDRKRLIEMINQSKG